MSELFWRPIATASGDSQTSVWLWYPDFKRGFEGFTYRHDDGSIGATSTVRGADPTHWMPLPRPPLKHSGDAA